MSDLTCYIKDNSLKSKEIEEKTKAFLAAGNKITVEPYGKSAYDGKPLKVSSTMIVSDIF